MDKRRGLVYLSLCGLLLLTALAIRPLFDPFTVTFLDVDQGDSILMETPEGHVVLIDTGATNQVVQQLGKELPFFEKTIDLFILTHPDLDHYGGFLDVLQNYNVRRVAITGIQVSTSYYRELIDLLNARGVEWWFLSAESDVQMSPQYALDVLYPFADQPLLGQVVKNKNDTSISVRLVRRASNEWEPLILLTGDGEADLERELLLSGQDVRAPIFKAGHHGSRTSNTPAFLSAVAPHTVVISAGRDNSFGHPHAEIMERFRFLTVYQTMDEGNVKFSFEDE